MLIGLWKFKTVDPRLIWDLQFIEKQFSPAQVMKAKAVSALSKNFILKIKQLLKKKILDVSPLHVNFKLSIKMI